MSRKLIKITMGNGKFKKITIKIVMNLSQWLILKLFKISSDSFLMHKCTSVHIISTFTMPQLLFFTSYLYNILHNYITYTVSSKFHFFHSNFHQPNRRNHRQSVPTPVQSQVESVPVVDQLLRKCFKLPHNTLLWPGHQRRFLTCL